MLCCLQTPWSNSNDAYQHQTGDFPGNRRFTKTAGNALAAAPSQQQPQSHVGGTGDIVCVTIPPGVSPGQAILVTAPDGSGRTVMVTVPQGLSAGCTFMAEFPPNSTSTSPPPSVISSDVLASAAPPQPAHVEVEPVDYSKMAVLPPPAQETPAVEPFAQAVPVGVGPMDTTISSSPNRPLPPLPRPISPPTQSSSPMSATFGQPMLRVQVPPGTAPGSTLHVAIPGENRTIAAVVPPGNVSSFHVPYESHQQAVPAVVAPQPINTSNQKLLLVTVPPGTAPGTTLHVSIPDEPGRVVAATVPPNVSEFQVAYTPLNNQNTMNRGFQQAECSNGGARNNNSNGNRFNNNNRNSGGSGMSSMLLPALGGTALGMMGMSMFDHAHHSNYDNNNGGDYNNYGDAGNDYGGGGDYGGGFDGGGFGDF